MKKIFSKFEIRYILINLHYIFPIKPSEFKIFISVESYGEKTAENLPKLIHYRKAHGFQTIKDIDPKF